MVATTRIILESILAEIARTYMDIVHQYTYNESFAVILLMSSYVVITTFERSMEFI